VQQRKKTIEVLCHHSAEMKDADDGGGFHWMGLAFSFYVFREKHTITLSQISLPI
jgi:hypothetical protein